MDTKKATWIMGKVRGFFAQGPKSMNKLYLLSAADSISQKDAWKQVTEILNRKHVDQGLRQAKTAEQVIARTKGAWKSSTKLDRVRKKTDGSAPFSSSASASS